MAPRWFRFAVLFPAAVSCGQLLGVEDYRTEAADPTEAGPELPRIVYANTACGHCTETSCEDELAACAADPECAEFTACFSGCPTNDGACQGRCVEAAPGKPAAWGVVTSCAARECPDCWDCTTAFALIGGEACAECAALDVGPGGICEKVTECAHDPECALYNGCLFEECDGFDHDPACRLTCGSRHPEGARRSYQEIGGQYFTSCASQCGGGQQWDCVQPTMWPSVDSGTATVTLSVPAGTSGRACDVRDATCTSPAALGAADAGDSLVFELPISDIPEFGDYFELTLPEPFPGPFIFVPWQPFIDDVTLWPPLYDPSFIQQLETAIVVRDETIDFMGQGVIVVYVVDCIGGLADYRLLSPPTRITAMPEGRAVFNTSGQFDAALTGGGLAAFYNVPGPSTTLAVTRDDKGIARAVVPVRPATITVVTFNYPQFF